MLQLNSGFRVKPGMTREFIMSTINYKDFTKLDIRAGTILEAEQVPETDKLLQLQVDFGSEKRQIVSGIKEWYDPESLVGKQACFVFNLEPRTIRGVESNGMIMATTDEKSGKVVVVRPHKKVTPGSKIS